MGARQNGRFLPQETNEIGTIVRYFGPQLRGTKSPPFSAQIDPLRDRTIRTVIVLLVVIVVFYLFPVEAALVGQTATGPSLPFSCRPRPTVEASSGLDRRTIFPEQLRKSWPVMRLQTR